jgi:hypothetical protein
VAAGVLSEVERRWRRQAAELPLWVLEEELAERGRRSGEAAVRLPGLVVDPVASVLIWNGSRRTVCGRRMEILYALAQARAAGRERVRLDVLARAVFRGFALRDAEASVRTYASYLYHEIPGLVHGPGRGKGGKVGQGYGLNLDEPASEESAA